MAHFIFNMPSVRENASNEERISALEDTVTQLVQTLEYVLAHIDGDNLTSDFIERIKEVEK